MQKVNPYQLADELRALLESVARHCTSPASDGKTFTALLERSENATVCSDLIARLIDAYERLLEMDLLSPGNVSKFYPDLPVEQLSLRTDKLLNQIVEIESA